MIVTKAYALESGTEQLVDQKLGQQKICRKEYTPKGEPEHMRELQV
jgi:hypothetical protein